MKTGAVPAEVHDFRQAFGRRIRAARVAHGLSQLAVSRATGMATQASLSNYEHGKRDIPLVLAVAIASVLEVPLSELLGEGRDGKWRGVE